MSVRKENGPAWQRVVVWHELVILGAFLPLPFLVGDFMEESKTSKGDDNNEFKQCTSHNHSEALVLNCCMKQ